MLPLLLVVGIASGIWQPLPHCKTFVSVDIRTSPADLVDQLRRPRVLRISHAFTGALKEDTIVTPYGGAGSLQPPGRISNPRR